MTTSPPPTGLPIEAVSGQVVKALSTRSVAVVRAEPGAGKSTVLPLRLREGDWLGDQGIVVLQPRRLAARATATRMAELLGERVGETVGYRIRGERRVGPRTRIEVVTEGMLTRRLQYDPSLDGVGLVILDEVHERNLQTDLALALTLDVRRGLRPDLCVLAMSATIEADRLAEIMGEPDAPAPYIDVEGRLHPVDIRWRPRPRDGPMANAVIGVIGESLANEDGDVLVFLPGAAAIRRVERGLVGTDSGPSRLPAHVDVRPLFGALGPAEQDAALAPSPPGRRRVVLSTDIAETSLTVAGIRIVIDAGEARRPRHDPRSGLTRLETRSSSRASAAQRAGRAGRTEPGVAYRLWDAHEHGRREQFAEPEILAVDLAGLCLDVAVWGADIDELSFMDPPPAVAYGEAEALLRRLGAVDVDGRPTSVGRAMSELPLHPRLAHMVVACSDTPQAWSACVIAALLEERDVLSGRPEDVPADLGGRMAMVEAGRGGDRVRRVRGEARQLARRTGISPGQLDVTACGPVVALAYPDRIAQARGGGRFRLRSGRGATLNTGDALTAEPFVVVAELGGSDAGGDERIRIAAPLDRDDVERLGGSDIVEETSLEWDTGRDDLVSVTRRRLDAVVLASTTATPPPGPDVIEALVDRVRSGGLDQLGWTRRARTLQSQAAFARSHLGGDWPDLSDAGLIASLDQWLPPLLVTAQGRADLGRVDMARVLRHRLGHAAVASIDEIAPATVTVSSGRAVVVDYASDPPSIEVRAQELFGTNQHPAVGGGRVPLTVHLLSPAGRPIQVTADLPGFWKGSWNAVRKDMAGRYPKHNWPSDPTTAEPSTRAQRRR